MLKSTFYQLFGDEMLTANNMSRPNYSNNSGFILITAMTVMTLLITLAATFIDINLSDKQITRSNEISNQNYYLAESAVNEAIWKINTDNTWKTNFQTQSSWTTTLTRNNPFGANTGSYSVKIQNTNLATANITATSTLQNSNIPSTRGVESKIFQAQGGNSQANTEFSILADGNLTMTGGAYAALSANLQVNGNINASNYSYLVSSSNDIKSTGAINNDWTSYIYAPHIFSSNHPPAATTVALPAIDFNSSSDTSFLKRATVTYDANDFDKLIKKQVTTILNGIIYVKGNVNIPKGRIILIYGLLVIEGNFKLGTSNAPANNFNPSLTIIPNGSNPSGLLATGTINLGNSTGVVLINGVLYSSQDININTNPTGLSILGAMYGRNISLSNLWGAMSIQYYEPYVTNVFNSTQSNSPIIKIQHWEETY